MENDKYDFDKLFMQEIVVNTDWSISTKPDDAGFCDMVVWSGEEIGEEYWEGGEAKTIPDYETAERLALCWNYCRGLSNDALRSGKKSE